MQQLNAALAPGSAGTELQVLVATAAGDGPTQYLVGSVYDSDGVLLSIAETWVVIGGELLALSAGANEYSTGVPDARNVLVGPDEGLNSPVQIDLVACAKAALPV